MDKFMVTEELHKYFIPLCAQQCAQGWIEWISRAEEKW